MQKLYIVYTSDDDVFCVKAQNKKEAIALTVGTCLDLKKSECRAFDLEKEMFHQDGFNKKVVMLM